MWDIDGFISRLNAFTGKKYRLPAEAEWEYAARGGASSEGYKYAGSNNAGDVAWYGNAKIRTGHYKHEADDSRVTVKEWYDYDKNAKAHPAGALAPNELGLYDMSGNVFEAVSDKSEEHGQIIRGGGYFTEAKLSRITSRCYSRGGKGVGFRLAMSL